MGSARSPCKDLFGEDLTRTPARFSVLDLWPQARTGTTVLCEPAQPKCTWTSHNSNVTREFTGKVPCAKTGTTPRPTLCASLRSPNAQGTWTSHKSNFGKMPSVPQAPGPGQSFCASLRSRIARGDVTRAILRENSRGKNQDRETPFFTREFAEKCRGPERARTMI